MGQTINIHLRMLQHMSTARFHREKHRTHIYRWLLELDDLGMTPHVYTIGFVKPEHATKAEYGWIKRLWKAGYNLVNSTGCQTPAFTLYERSLPKVSHLTEADIERMRQRDTTRGPKRKNQPAP